jgi:protein-S-isoprenylcysteine O-methyltransferase Ste14
LDVFFPVTISVPRPTVFATICFAVGPLLILWAQYTSHRFEIIKKQTGQPQFNRGPYKYLRNPTQLGLLILVAGYTLVSQAATLFIATGIAYIISNVFFKKHESILESKYSFLS